jgi:DNA helicase-2/ATP-dependent DNA helicase PcrA
MLPINTRGMWIGTFHGLCNRLLRAHHREAGLPQRSRSSIRPTSSRCDQAPVEESQRRRREVPAARAACTSSTHTRNTGLRAPQVEAYDDYTSRASSCIPSTKRSASAKASSISPNCCCAAYELLQRNEPLRRHYQARFRTSWSTSSRTPTSCSTPGCSSLAASGRRRRACVFAVGDDDQSSTRFRGAESATCATSSASSSRRATSSASSRTIARTATSSTPPTR